MIKRREINSKIYAISNDVGDIGFGNETGISYLKYCIEEKEIRKYAKENNVKLFALGVAEFFVIGCFVNSAENDIKRNVL